MTIFQISHREELLLRAATNPDGDVAAEMWNAWTREINLEEAPYPELRLLTAAYANLTRVAPSLKLPNKLRGKAKATFAENSLLAKGCLPIIAELSRHSPVLLTKGFAFCTRFDAWSSRTMGDVDIHITRSSLKKVCAVLAQEGWTPKYGMTWESLVHRSSLRRSSWNVTKGASDLDLHWRALEGAAEEGWLSRTMWATAEQMEFLGHAVLLQSAEFAFVSSLTHGFKEGTHADMLQTVVDATYLLPLCRPKLLTTLLSRTDLVAQCGDLFTMLEKLGLAELTSRLTALRSASNASAKPTSAHSRSGMHRTEVALLRYPKLYRLWEAFGRKAWFERLLLRWSGPFSKPFAYSGEFNKDYDLRDCAVVDQVGGPGWSWPEPEHTCFWSDRADARLLIPLSDQSDHLIVLGIAEHRVDSPNARIAVFANGSYLATFDFTARMATSEYCLFVPRYVLFGSWVEISLRPQPYLGEKNGAPGGYALSRSVPVRRLRVFDMRQMSEVFSGYSVPQLYFAILKEEEPQASKFARIRKRIEESPYRNASEIPTGFNPVLYVLSYPDLFEHEVDPYEHYMRHGIHEGREWH